MGGAVVAVNPADSWFFPDDPRQAVLWDIRVHPAHRETGIAKALLQAAISCAARKGCRRLCIETQDTNVAACRLYASVGASLTKVLPGAYADHAEDAALLWQIEL